MSVLVYAPAPTGRATTPTLHTELTFAGSFEMHLEFYFMYSTKILIAAVTAVFLATSMGCASTRTQESTGQYIDDTVITSKVKAAIIGESTLSAAEINVETFKGVVQLSGFVSSAADIATAIRLARTVSGVRDVKNGMNVK